MAVNLELCINYDSAIFRTVTFKKKSEWFFLSNILKTGCFQDKCSFSDYNEGNASHLDETRVSMIRICYQYACLIRKKNLENLIHSITKMFFQFCYFSAVHLTRPRLTVFGTTQFINFTSNIILTVILNCRNSPSRKTNECFYFACFTHFPAFLFPIL